MTSVERASGDRRHRHPLNARRILLALLVSALMGVALSGALDGHGERMLQSSMTRALVTFATARTVNAVLSSMQGTELALQPAGVGVTLTPGEVLDPVDDLVEHFSDVMLFAAAAVGVQRALLGMSQWWVIELISAALLLTWWVLLWLGHGGRNYRIVSHLLLLALLFRLAMPVLGFTVEQIHRNVFAVEYQQASADIAEQSAALDELQDEQREMVQQGAEQSVVGKLNSWMSDIGDRVDIKKQLAHYQALANRLVDNMIQLMVIFLVETVLLPLLVLWLLWQLLRWTVHIYRHEHGYPEGN